MIEMVVWNISKCVCVNFFNYKRMFSFLEMSYIISIGTSKHQEKTHIFF